MTASLAKDMDADGRGGEVEEREGDRRTVEAWLSSSRHYHVLYLAGSPVAGATDVQTRRVFTHKGRQ